MATAVNVSATNNADIDGMLSGSKWSGAITYSFPDSPSDYPSPSTYGSNEPSTSFSQAPSQMQSAINYAVGLICGYTNISLQYAGTNGADVMVAQSSAANPTSYAYYPGNYAEGGDVWFGTSYPYAQAALGNYYFTTALHEFGHALGLKHSQETGGPANVAVPTAHDDSEYTVMSYRSYVGAPLTGYTAETYGFSQTYMANDILALQTMYGANYTTHNENTVYTWSTTTGQEFINGVAQPADGGGAGGSANRIFETIWDGGGVDTYDLSNYATDLSINLNPGASSLFSATQIAYLGDGHYAAGNVYNAYLYNGDTRSLIDNATGGSGNDTIIGNVIANVLNGGGGNDTITGGGGNDTVNGGAGTDTEVFSGNRANYTVAYNSATQTFTITDLRTSSPDGTDTVTAVEYFQFADQTVASATLTGPLALESVGVTALVLDGSNYELNPTAGGTGPILKNGGAAVLAGHYGAWSPVAAEQVSGGGYDVAWKNSSTGYFSIWSTDSNGNFLSTLTPEVPGTDPRLIALETSFHQDLNGDGSIGPLTTTIEAQGTTSLIESAGNYHLDPTAGGTGPILKNGGTAVVAGNYGAWSPVAAEQVSGGGYEVAWKNASTGYFSVWSTDSNGNFVSTLTPEVPGTDSRLISLETSFHQDLNGDGKIGTSSGPANVTIENVGSTSLVQTASGYELDSISTGTGPVLKNGGAAVIAGNYGDWSPVAAEQVSGGGYDVAWKNASTGYFSVWSTDSNGNFVSTLTPEVPGTDSRLKALEPAFHQDLNGDGAVGAAPLAAGAAIASDGFVFAHAKPLPGPSEAPDPMPVWTGAQPASWPSAFVGASASHDAIVHDASADLLHTLHDSGFILG